MTRVRYDNQYISYILEDNFRFFITGYRVLKKQKSKGLIPCSKVMFNGHIKLLYSISGYVPLSVAAVKWEPKEVILWMIKILKVLMGIQDNGFLQMETVDVDLSHIFIDVGQAKVYLIALPLTVEPDLNHSCQWETELRKSLISLMEISKNPESGPLSAFRQEILVNRSSLKDLYKIVKETAIHKNILSYSQHLSDGDENAWMEDKPESEKNLYFVSRSPIKKVELLINKDEYILGKNPKIVDGLLDLSPTISRKHCKIIKLKQEYYIEDLESANHTYVNGEIVERGKRVRIKPGDQIRLAEIEFGIEFRDLSAEEKYWRKN